MIRRLGPVAAVIALCALALCLLSSVALGLYGDSAAVGGNSFTTCATFAGVKSVQTGTTTSTANGTATVTITSVDTGKSFLIFNTSHNSNRPVGSTLRGRIATSTTIEFVRVTDEASPATITVRWYVVEYYCGVHVQRGEVVQSATTINVAITPVASLSQAFVTWSKTPEANDTAWNENDAVLGELTSTSNLQFRTDAANSSHVLWWQIIEYADSADINVQKGSTSLTGGALSTTVTLPTSVDPAKSFVLVGFRSDGSGSDIGDRMLRAQLTNSTTLTIDRSSGDGFDNITEIVWQAVELKDGTTVQRGSESFASGVAQKTVATTAVDTTRSVAFASVQGGAGQSMGRSSYSGDDIPGVGSVTASLSSTQLTLDRANTAAAADIAWFVVEFAP